MVPAQGGKPSRLSHMLNVIDTDTLRTGKSDADNTGKTVTILKLARFRPRDHATLYKQA